ncbi:condensin subunit ScpA [Keratinibaculum paraultunense]|uniref:Segregation and condensation protein A n=1 Tax=Keratinibaculum paraultunense TaxID=1278232 RepID=A0A4R3KYW2_9FIRM|nr:segregation/condensation protein A [Keratinibaculum paraultunense]QQY80637.1 segregation/condensation protein A [Keratinibaculum paraultunense]TCS91370.1 condensin subunit ScpA [Keratinibaculum paraultunense]
MEYKIILESFEGPMDLLLHLIDEAKIDIYDIPINEITEQYLEYITKMEELDLEITSDFLLMAATLLEIKSKMLLPQLDKNEEKQLEMEENDPRLELTKKLIEYKKFKYISKELKEYEEIQRKVFYKPKEDLSLFIEEDESLKPMDLDELVKAFNCILAKTKDSNNIIDVDKIQREEYTLDKCMENIKKKLSNKKQIKFQHLFDENVDKQEIIVTFLSLLELIKMKEVVVYQEKNFSNIVIKKRGV